MVSGIFLFLLLQHLLQSQIFFQVVPRPLHLLELLEGLELLQVDVAEVEGGAGGVLHGARLVGQGGEQAEEPVASLGPLDGDRAGGVGVELDGPVGVGPEGGLGGGQLLEQVLQLVLQLLGLLLLGSSLDLTWK